jgi:hypothetical protein
LGGLGGRREKVVLVAYEDLFVGDGDLIAVRVEEDVGACDGMLTAKGNS